ncbi:MAG: hypothetical protein GYB53_21810 [Rhodobacteraceae bacterium]|nr:hypothetical protein [Paracoccaceae bacterium]
MTDAPERIWTDYRPGLYGHSVSHTEPKGWDVDPEEYIRADLARPVPQPVGVKPRYFGVWSATGVHIGVWDDGKTAYGVLSEYPGGQIVEMVPVSALDPQPAMLSREEADAMVAADRAENCVNCIGKGTDMNGDPCDHGLPTDAQAALKRQLDAAKAEGRREGLHHLQQISYLASQARPVDLYHAVSRIEDIAEQAIRAHIEKEGPSDG